MPRIVAEDIMSEEVVTIPDDMQVSQVAHMMLRNKTSAFPVVSRDGNIVGIITMTDLFEILHHASQQYNEEDFHLKMTISKDITVGNVMSKDVVTIRKKTALSEIIELIAEKGIHTYPVVEEGKCVGLITRNDALNAVFSYA